MKAGAKAIKFHLDYLGWLLDQRRWLAGDVMTLADFAAAAHLSALDYISDVDWNRNANVKDWYAKIKSRPAFRSLLADQVPGVSAAAALLGPRFLSVPMGTRRNLLETNVLSEQAKRG